MNAQNLIDLLDRDARERAAMVSSLNCWQRLVAAMEAAGYDDAPVGSREGQSYLDTLAKSTLLIVRNTVTVETRHAATILVARIATGGAR